MTDLLAGILPTDLAGWFALITAGIVLLVMTWRGLRRTTHMVDHVDLVPAHAEKLAKILGTIDTIERGQRWTHHRLDEIETVIAAVKGDVRDVQGQIEDHTRQDAENFAAIETQIKEQAP